MGIDLSARPSGGEGGYADDGRITSAPLRNEAISVLASQRSTHIITSEMLAGAGAQGRVINKSLHLLFD